MSKYVGFRLGKVHESHVISEYYCGGCGWPVTDHDSFCPECGGAFRFRTCDASNLEAENAKLRELVKDIHTLATDYGVYVQYPYCDAWDEKLAVVEKQMRELGIEANG